MIRSINDQYGFADRYTVNEYLIKHDSFPAQTNAVGKYISISFLDHINQTFNYRINISKTTYDQFVNLIPKSYELNNNYALIFKIVRFDAEYPYRAILVSTYGHIIVTTTEDVNKIGYYNAKYCNQIKNQIINMNKTMYTPYIASSEEDFFQSFATERICIFPEQSLNIFGRRVWIEYQQDVLDTDYNDPNIIQVPKNKYEFTDQMAKDVVERDRTLEGIDRKHLESYPVYYNIHSKSFIDNPRRAMNTGYVVRADINDSEGQIVVLEIRNNKQYYVCLDEARFFYNTEDTARIDVTPPDKYIKNNPKNLYNYIESLG